MFGHREERWAHLRDHCTEPGMGGPEPETLPWIFRLPGENLEFAAQLYILGQGLGQQSSLNLTRHLCFWDLTLYRNITDNIVSGFSFQNDL